MNADGILKVGPVLDMGDELNVTNWLFEVMPLIFEKSEKTKSGIIFQPEIKQKAYGLY